MHLLMPTGQACRRKARSAFSSGAGARVGHFTELVLIAGFALAVAAGWTAVAAASQPIVWAALYEPSCGGWETSLAVSPHDRSRILLGGDILGIGLSLDGGDSWMGTYGLRCWEIADFTWHPTDSNIVWVGTLGGPYQSTDGGRNWTSRRTGMPAVSRWIWTVPIQKILFDPNNPVRLLTFGGNHQGNGDRANEHGNVYESTNSGSAWRRLGTVQPGGNIVEAAFAAGSSTMLYAAVEDYGVCVSESGGVTWQLRTNGLPSGRVKDLAVHPTNQLVAYALLYNIPLGTGQYESGGVWMTTNGGTNWVARNAGIRRNTGSDPNFVSRFESIAMCHADPNRLVTSDTSYNWPRIYVSYNGGQSWVAYQAHPLFMPSGAGMTGVEFDPADADTMFGFGSEYLLRSRDGGRTWEDISSLVVAGQPGFRGRGYTGWVTSRFAWHPTDPQGSIFTGWDHGFGWQSRNGLRTWTRGGNLPAWGGAFDVSWGANNSVYTAHGQPRDERRGVTRSLDGGNTFTVLTSANSPGLPTNGTPLSIYARPDAPGDVWVCWNGLLRSTNFGARWNSVPVGGNPRWIAADPNAHQRIYVGCANGVYQSANGATFQLMPGSPQDTTRITVDTAGRVFAVNWVKDGGGLYRFATNRWTQLRYDKFIVDVAVDPRNPQRLMIVTYDDPYYDETVASGVWTSEDDGRTWRQQNLGLSNLRATCVSVSPHDPDLWIVGTGGRGFFITRWADLSLRREGASVPPRWRVFGTPNLEAVLEHSTDLRQWRPFATNTLPMDGWVFGSGSEPFDFIRAKVSW